MNPLPCIETMCGNRTHYKYVEFAALFPGPAHTAKSIRINPESWIVSLNMPGLWYFHNERESESIYWFLSDLDEAKSATTEIERS